MSHQYFRQLMHKIKTIVSVTNRKHQVVRPVRHEADEVLGHVQIDNQHSIR